MPITMMDGCYNATFAQAMRKCLFVLLFALVCCSSAWAQGNQCRTATVGTSSPNCASEAFVTDTVPVPAALPTAIGQLPGVTTNTAANAGNVGQVITSGAITTGSLTSGSPVAATSIPLTPGDWDISAEVEFNTSGGTTVTDWYSSISTTSASIAAPITGSLILHERVAAMNDHSNAQTHMPAQVLLASPTTYFFNIESVFTGTATTATVILRARRMR